MKKRARTVNIDTVFVLIIFSVFALSVLLVLMLGAGIYKNISDISRDSENERTALSYVRTKVRNLDTEGAVYVAPLDSSDNGFGITALYIREDIGGSQYLTVIYAYDGWLLEMFCESSLVFKPEDGMRVTKIDDLRFAELEEGLIKISSGDLSLLLTIRSGSMSGSVLAGMQAGGDGG